MSAFGRLFEIRKDLLSNNFEISIHAYIRMAERNITAVDILFLVKTGLKDFLWNEDHETWNFTGPSFDGRKFTIACAYNDFNTLIVTVYWV